jgi:hypothetical protein
MRSAVVLSCLRSRISDSFLCAQLLFVRSRISDAFLWLQVLREQGLGMHIDEDFIAAATAEMQEAMNMSPAEFEAAAEQLLIAEKGGAFR